MSSLPIADYGLVSDCHSAALVSRMGSIDWLCFPRFDAPSLFGRLLDDNAGHWSIHPAVECTTTRRYIALIPIGAVGALLIFAGTDLAISRRLFDSKLSCWWVIGVDNPDRVDA